MQEIMRPFEYLDLILIPVMLVVSTFNLIFILKTRHEVETCK